MPMTMAAEQALRAVRAACAQNPDALAWLDEVEWALAGPAPVERMGRTAAVRKLAAWNAWAAQ